MANSGGYTAEGGIQPHAYAELMKNILSGVANVTEDYGTSLEDGLAKVNDYRLKVDSFEGRMKFD
jgi:hypothetical protein